MAKQVRAARHYRAAITPLRQIADGSRPKIARDLKAALDHLPELIPENADDYARRADWTGLKAAIDFNHFRETLKAAFASIGKVREAAAQHGVQQINGRFAQAGRKVRYRKYSPNQPRDERGRWVAEGGEGSRGTQRASVTVGGKRVRVTLSQASKAADEKIVVIDTKAFDEAWKRDKSFYTGPKGAGESSFPGRYERFQRWLAENDHMEASSVGVQRNGSVGFVNGRHRYAVLRDMGVEAIPVAMDGESIKNAEKHGYLRLRKDDNVLDVLFDKDASDRYVFDLYSQEVQDELRAAQDQLIQQLEQDARDAIDQIILNGAMEGLGPNEIMDDIRSWIGLTARQSQAVANYRQMLENLDHGALDRQLRNFLEDDQVQAALDSGEDLDSALIDKLTQDYADNYLDYRAETIADTESTRAVNSGLQDAYSQAIDRGVFPADAVRQYWRLGPNPCEVCQSIPDMNPDGVAIDESFESIDGPMDAPPDPHPSCQCDIEVVTNLDMVPDDGEG